MSRTLPRRATLILAAAAALLVAAFAATPPASASTLYACAKKNGTAHVFKKKPKCKKGETKLSWNTVGPAGANGANGTNGTNGANGLPQKVVKFSSTLKLEEKAPLFSADGNTYEFECVFALFFSIGEITAQGSGMSYGQGVFGRPIGQESLENDAKSSTSVQTISSKEPTSIAFATNAAENKAKQIEQNGVWTVSVEGPTTVTLIHAVINTSNKCTLHGTALTLPF